MHGPEWKRKYISLEGMDKWIKEWLGWLTGWMNESVSE